MALPVYPTALMCFEGFEADIERRSLSGGTALSGEEDIVETDGGGRWFAEAGSAYLDDPEIALAFDAQSARFSGGATPLIVPFTDARSQMMGTVTVPRGGLPWWQESDFGTPDTGVEVADDAALRATQLTLTVTGLAKPIRHGQKFSIDHATHRHRAYKVIEVAEDGDQIVVSFRPPLREATDAGTAVDFLDPKCVMRVDGEMRSPRTLGFAEGSVRFVEHFAESYS